MWVKEIKKKKVSKVDNRSQKMSNLRLIKYLHKTGLYNLVELNGTETKRDVNMYIISGNRFNRFIGELKQLKIRFIYKKIIGQKIVIIKPKFFKPKGKFDYLLKQYGIYYHPMGGFNDHFLIITKNDVGREGYNAVINDDISQLRNKKKINYKHDNQMKELKAGPSYTPDLTLNPNSDYSTLNIVNRLLDKYFNENLGH
jgi:hypothetical protein